MAIPLFFPDSMRVLTCTPVAFGGGPEFFARDSGLLCRGLQSIGIESRAVMPLPTGPDDQDDLIRVPFGCLESPTWWRSQEIDGVVLYAWGHPKFRQVAAAIHDAGAFLVLNQDNSGFISPRAGVRGWLREQWVLAGEGRSISSLIRAASGVLRGLVAGLLITDPLRARHLQQGDVIACVSPKAAERYRRLCRAYGGTMLAERVAVIPHAVETRFRHSGAPKAARIACVGRWDDSIQKRPRLMMDVLARTLAADPEPEAIIAGKETPELRAWHRGLEATVRRRIRLVGILDREALATLLDGSRVFYSASSYESFGIAAAEALCSGCSVVGVRSASMAAFEWFVTAASGTLAERDRVEEHVLALREELAHWNAGHRDASAISNHWCGLLHADRVAHAIVAHLTGSPSP